MCLASCKTREHVATSQGMAKLDFDFSVEPARIDTASIELTIGQIDMLPVGAQYSIPTASGGRATIKNTGTGITLMAESVKNGPVKIKGNAAAQNKIREVWPEDDKDNKYICLISIFVVLVLTAFIIFTLKTGKKVRNS